MNKSSRPDWLEKPGVGEPSLVELIQNEEFEDPRFQYLNRDLLYAQEKGAKFQEPLVQLLWKSTYSTIAQEPGQVSTYFRRLDNLCERDKQNLLTLARIIYACKNDYLSEVNELDCMTPNAEAIIPSPHEKKRAPYLRKRRNVGLKKAHKPYH